MAIAEAQLETWSHQGSIAQSKATCNKVRRVLHASDAPYAGRAFDTFLQGSYANDSNIFAHSDVDIVVRLNSTYHYDITNLPAEEQEAFKRDLIPATYGHGQFKQDVATQLARHFGVAVTLGAKAISVAGDNTRRDADVLPAAIYYHYSRYRSIHDLRRVEGVIFWVNGVPIVNYPAQHSANCTAKHKRTQGWFKPLVRIFKNMGNRMVAHGLIAEGLAPSYFLEGMLYNVPDEIYGLNYQTTVAGTLAWLTDCNCDTLVCANEQYVLIHPNSPVTWQKKGFEAFLAASIRYWNQPSGH